MVARERFGDMWSGFGRGFGWRFFVSIPGAVASAGYVRAATGVGTMAVFAMTSAVSAAPTYPPRPFSRISGADRLRTGAEKRHS